MTDKFYVSGSDGVQLYMTATGPKNAQPILFIHGFTQSHLCWNAQMNGPLAEQFRLLTVDMRGHGMSEKPEGFAPYQDSRLWADDLKAAIDACATPPIVVAWSYAGNMLGDYLRHYGEDSLAGIVLVCAILSIGHTRPPATEDTPVPIVAEDIAVSVPALAEFSRKCILPTGDQAADIVKLSELTANALLVPPHARRGMIMRSEAYFNEYASVTKPALILFTDKDEMVQWDEFETARDNLKHAETVVYKGIGHMPFYEATERFDNDIARFAQQVVLGEAA